MDKLLRAIIDFPKQLNFKPFLIQKSRVQKWKPDGIIIFGMGGSALPGETIKALIKEFNIPAPIVIWKNYGLPNHFFKNPLLIFTSFSGNTEETIDAFIKSENYKFRAVVTGGGKLEKMAKNNKAPLILIPQDYLTPRQAIGYMIFAQLRILKEIFPKIKVPAVKLDVKKLESKGRLLAQSIGEKIPLIYASKQNLFLANYWKVNFNETNGIPSFCNFLPEINHNEIAGFSLKTLNKNFFAIFLMDKSDDGRIQKRTIITKEFFNKNNLESIALQEKNDRIANAFNSFILSDWTSYYLAKLKKTDPLSGTQAIEQFKKIMKENR